MSFWWPVWRNKSATGLRSSRSRLFRPDLEVLEGRLLLSTFTVFNTNDGGFGSLRQAILDANSHPNPGGPDVIAFAIGGSGPQSIALGSALPAVTDAVLIDGTTQPGYSASSPHPVVELNGAGAGGGAAGLVLSGSDITVRALAINRFNGAGVVIVGNGNQLEGDYIGTDVSGTARLGNGGAGVALTNGASGNYVGGSSGGQGNVIAANGGDGVQITGGSTAGNFIQGNFIGTDATGTVALNNGFSGVAIFNAAHDNLVGGPGLTLAGPGSGAGNLISGNGADGVFVGNFGSGPGGNNTVQGNYIGTDVTGTRRLANGGQGVKLIDGAFNNLIGGPGLTLAGPGSGAGNLISGNNGDGVYLGNNGGGNPTNNTLQGNLIGTDATGSARLGNSHNGVEITSGAVNTLVGGTSAGMGNVVAASGGDGVQITGQFTANNVVQGNFLGTNAAGTGALGNGFAGVAIFNSAHDNLVGGTTGVNPGGRLAGAGNLISGNGTDGVFLGNFGVGGARFNTVQGNYIGTDVSGAATLGNGAHGVEFNSSLNNLVGGTTAAARNVIAASAQNGVYFQSGASGNTVQGNLIGTNAAGTGALGNTGPGVLAVTGSSNNMVIGNTIANNAAGVSLDASVWGWAIQSNVIAANGKSAAPGNSGVIIGGGQSDAIRANAIYGNAYLGIDLGNDGVTLNNTAGHSGANRFQNFPTLTSASTTGGNFTVGGTLSSSPYTTYTLDFFANAAFGLGGFGQGQTYLGSATVTTDAGGNANFSFGAPLVSGQGIITATATDPSGDTSEFSHGLSLLTAPGVPVTATEGAAFTAPVATFSDPGGDPAGSFTAVIDWGDNHTSAGVVTATGGSFTVSGSHTYAEEGSFSVRVTITDADGAMTSTGSTATVSDAALLNAAAVNVNATEGLGFNAVVATFTDANPNGAANDFTATITWGDGTTSAGGVSPDGSGGFRVTGGHAYAEEGSYAVRVTVNDIGGSSFSVSGAATVADAPLTATGASITATEGTSFSGVVATFSDANPGATLGDFSATISWGDGRTSAGTVSANGGGFSVAGTHSYASSGPYTVTVSIADVGGSTATATSLALITDADLTATGITITAVEGAAFSGVVATFTDANPAGRVSDFSASIDWGDGTSSAGAVSADGSGGFQVTGTHTYADEGRFAVRVRIVDVGGAGATAVGAAVITDAPLSASGVAVAATEGAAFSGAVATFTDANPFATAGDFTATITWGDGSSSAGTVSAGGSGGFVVTGGHTYAEEGSYAVHVTINDAGGSTTSADSSASVADAPLTAAGTSISATEGAAFGGVVATFADANPFATVGEFSATITWGDGSLSSGSVSADGGGFVVTGSHTYVEEGRYAVHVTVNDVGGSSASAVTTVTVADAPLTAAGAAVAAVEGAAFSGVVATFTDANPNAAVGDFSTVIRWGDGTTSGGSVTLAAGIFSVTGTHTYAEEGSYAISVTIADVGGSTATVGSSAAVADAPLTASGVAVAATEGVAFSGAVATFTDANPFAAAGEFSATITWGDGSSSAGAVSTDGSGGFVVAGGHTYADEGNYAVGVIIKDAGGSTAASSTATVLDAPLTAAGTSISATEGAAFSGVVATFTDGNPNAATGEFTATIGWGDGTTSAGTVSLSGGVFSVSGAHTYAAFGSYAVTVAINDVGGSTATAHSSATVADAPLTAAGVAISATAGTSFSGVVATSTDANPNGAAGDFSATISWGDGSSSAGSVAANGTGGFNVSGAHTYAAAGSYAVTVTINDVGGSSATAHGSATVAPSSGLSVQGKSISATEGIPTGPVTVATFTDPSGSAAAAQYQSQIVWGDGTTSAGTVVAVGDGSFRVKGSHTYAEEGTYATAVHVTRSNGTSGEAKGTAVVADAPLFALGTLVSATPGTGFTGLVAVFADLNLNETAGAFTATIHWGDGTTSLGLVQAVQPGIFTVVGSHAYAAAGTCVYTVDIADAGGSSATALGVAAVAKGSSGDLAALGNTLTSSNEKRPANNGGGNHQQKSNDGAKDAAHRGALISWLATNLGRLFGQSRHN
jgi:parallel beta-helix repeat protein